MKKRIYNEFFSLDDETKKYIQNGDLICIKDFSLEEDVDQEEKTEINLDDYVIMPEDEYIVE